MDKKTKKQIKKSNPFVCILPPEGIDGTEGEVHLRYAIKLGKHIIVYRAEGRFEIPIPSALEGYDDYEVLDGPIEYAALRILSYLGTGPGEHIKIHDKAWDD